MSTGRTPGSARADARSLFGLLVVVLAAVAAGALIADGAETSIYILGLIGVAIYVVLCLSRPFAAFIVLVFFAVTVWLSGIKVAGGVSAMIGIGAIFTLSWLVRLIARSESFIRVKEYGLLLALLMITGVTALLHLDGPAGSAALLTYVQLYLLFVLVVNLITTPGRLDAVSNLIVISSTLLAALILLDQIGWLPAALIPEQTMDIAAGQNVVISRTAGLWGDANFTALQLTIALPFILAAWSGASQARRALLLAAGAVILAAFVWTFSMGGLLGLSVMLLAAMLMTPRRHRLFRIARNSLFGVIALAALISSAPATFVQRVVVMFESNVSALSAFDQASLLTLGTNRGDTWWAALQAIAAAPWLGYGPGNAVYANASYSVLRLRSRNWVSPHNMLLAVAGDLGLVGLALFVALFIAALQAVRARPDAPAVEPGLQRDRQAIFIALIGYTVQSMALEIHNLKLLWVLLGMAIAARQIFQSQTFRGCETLQVSTPVEVS